MMDIERATYLLNGYHEEKLSESEYAEFFALLHEDQYALFREQWLDGCWSLGELQSQGEPNNERILSTIFKEQQKRSYRRTYSVVAAIVLFFSLVATVYTFVFSDFSPSGQLADIEPGGNKANIVLPNGEIVSLSEQEQGLSMKGEIRYLDGDPVSGLKNKIDASDQLALTVPRGGVYQITLSDGSEVWLNSESKLYYSAQLGKQKREVFLEGEAYFKVAKLYVSEGDTVRRVPFVVKTAKQTIEVLGTQFNVSAYGDEPGISTTLVEGKVKVTMDSVGAHGGINEMVLKPGESTITGTGGLLLNDLSSKQQTAWKEGYFDFTNMPLDQVMRQLGRWYGVDIAYEGKIPKIMFYGTIERNNRLSTIMTLLETNHLDYRLEKNKLTIIAKERKGGKI
ncbi:FecR family protein [Sphingobacterium sp. LRF_L2]|uniref:FecR family protein n=1 Tax=Sphingobacterium sp. LRF_L2 TaxID=3369421 RepID=UPI003F60787B